MINLIILSAGHGKRMKSDIPKVFHKIANREMLLIVDDISSLALQNEKINKIFVVSEEIVTGYSHEIPSNSKYIIQKERLGTANAVKIVFDANLINYNFEKTLILYGDTPLINDEIIKSIVESLNNSDISVLGFNSEDCNKEYGRIFLENGTISKIKEFKDFLKNETMPSICNSGVIAAKTSILKELLPLIKKNDLKNEYYLTDIIELASKKDYKSNLLMCQEEFVLGVNSKEDLAHCEIIFQNRLRKKHLQNGVEMKDPSSIYFSFDTKIGTSVILENNIVFKTGVEIGNNVNINAFSYLEEVKISDNCHIGPFCRIRGETVINSGCKIGNFVEIKNSKILNSTKAAHLAYIGDCDVGENVNFGAGSVICNYDGKNKHRSKINNNSFIGSNSTIISPREIGEKTFIAAGTVVNKDTEPHSLAIGRSKQVNINNWNKN